MSQYVRLLSATTIGVEGFIVEVEVDIQNGLPKFEITGLADSTIRESKERVRSAIVNSGYTFPIGRIIVNLAPADIRKEGTNLDLVIAIGILLSSKQVNVDSTSAQVTDYLITGELALDGGIRPIKGTLPIVEAAISLGNDKICIPMENIHEAKLIKGITSIGLSKLKDLVDYIEGKEVDTPIPTIPEILPKVESLIDYADVIGQSHGKRGMLIAAAGGYHLLMVGPPGSGKSMLAKRIVTIMPPMSEKEALEVRKIQSVSGMLLEQKHISSERPFRAPHHTITSIGLIGGMSPPKPGEISLAHHGVLFLDELTEFTKKDLEVLRQPLEDGAIVIVRGGLSIHYPASFQLIGALNPCPCGFYGSKTKDCTCKEWERKRYINKISGPFRDRFDLQVEVREVDIEEMESKNDSLDKENLSSKEMKDLVIKAREIQLSRQDKLNAKLNSKEIEKYSNMEDTAKVFIKQAYKQMGLSMRGYHKVLKVARTIADLEESEKVTSNHLAETLTYRSMEKYY